MSSTQSAATYFIKPLELQPEYGKNISEFRVIMTPHDGVTHVPTCGDAFYYEKIGGPRLIIKKIEDNGINIYTVEILTMNPKLSIEKKWFQNVAWIRL